MEYIIKISDDNIAAEALVKYLKTLDFVEVIKSEPVDWYDKLTTEQKASIQRGEDDLKAGRVVSNEDARKRIDAFLKNHA